MSGAAVRAVTRRKALVGKVIADRYRLVAPVGTGGMATVWRAQHQTLNQPIAIKFIEVAGVDVSGMRERFLREARVAAAIRHRNVVHILDFGTAEDGQPFMAMELLEGEALSNRIVRDPPITVGEAVRVVARTLSGLGAVHDAGIVHRDLKPENIILTQDADGVFPKLIDFGVSRALDHSGGIKSVLPTVENAIVGTPQYMSPEQARGLDDLDHRSDIWSAGVILYELLTGMLPYDGEAPGDVIIKIATEDPPDFARLRPDLRGAMEQVVKRAMAKRPDDRFQSAREMRAALLAAATETASRLQAAHVAQHPDVPTVEELDPRELLEAVGDSYEKGDSGVIDLTSHLDELDSLPAPPPNPHHGPPPGPSPSADPFADEVYPPAAFGTRLRQMAPKLVVGGAVVAALASLGVVWAFSEPAETDSVVDIPSAHPPAPAEADVVAEAPVAPTMVEVTLEGIPADAELRVDGEPRPDDQPLEIERDGEVHAIEVEASDGRVWRTEHRAEDDGHYEVSMPRRQRPRRRVGRRRARSPRTGAPRPPARGNSNLVRDPGF